jgi:hypothetical protein
MCFVAKFFIEKVHVLKDNFIIKAKYFYICSVFYERGIKSMYLVNFHSTQVTCLGCDLQSSCGELFNLGFLSYSLIVLPSYAYFCLEMRNMNSAVFHHYNKNLKHLCFLNQ